MLITALSNANKCTNCKVLPHTADLQKRMARQLVALLLLLLTDCPGALVKYCQYHQQGTGTSSVSSIGKKR